MTLAATIVFRDGKTAHLEVRPNELLMDAARRQGVQLPVDCREGVCATCRGLCESGEISQEYVDEEALTEAELAAGHMLACQTRLKSAATFYFDIDSTISTTTTKTYSAVVSKVEKISEAAAILEIKLTDNAPALKFLAGQYARIQIPDTDQWRAYSFANASTASSTLRFLIRLLPSGVMSDYLRERAQVGDHIQFEAPLGIFYLRKITRLLVFVAGGTGLSAFLAMLDEFVQKGGINQPVRLYYGVNYEADLSELARLEHYKAQLADFDYRLAVMHPSESWQGQKGVVCDVFDMDSLQQPFDAYLCGPPAMIEATKTWLAKADVAQHQLFFEKFTSS